MNDAITGRYAIGLPDQRATSTEAKVGETRVVGEGTVIKKSVA
jgi:hypothetical protein